jgi:hypothetical protein
VGKSGAEGVEHADFRRANNNITDEELQDTIYTTLFEGKED